MRISAPVEAMLADNDPTSRLLTISEASSAMTVDNWVFQRAVQACR
jgi:hypothetical protein